MESAERKSTGAVLLDASNNGGAAASVGEDAASNLPDKALGPPSVSVAASLEDCKVVGGGAVAGTGASPNATEESDAPLQQPWRRAS